MAKRTLIRRALETATSELEAAVSVQLAESYVELVGLTEVAIETLAYVAQYGRHEDARVSAAKEILDRAELTPEVRVTVSAGVADERTTRLEELRKQLGSMRGNLAQVIDLHGGDVIEVASEETG